MTFRELVEKEEKELYKKPKVDDLCKKNRYIAAHIPEFKEPIWKLDNTIHKKEINNMPPELFAWNEPVYLNVTFTKPNGYFEIKKVIFNNPATIVYWADGTKTVVKCGDDDVFDEEKGLAMAISKRALGNSGRYYETFKKWLPEEEEIGIDIIQRLTEVFKETKKFDGKKTSCYDWLKKYHPECINNKFSGGCIDRYDKSVFKGCPGDYFKGLPVNGKCAGKTCEECWKTNYIILSE